MSSNLIPHPASQELTKGENMESEVETYKVYFPLETTKDEAEGIIKQHDKTAEIANFYQKREIGCNTHTFAIVTMSLDINRMPSSMLKVDRMESLRIIKSGAECCGSSG